MKNLSLFVSAFVLCASTSFAAINCSTLPTCESLGYNDITAHCPKNVAGEEMAVKCPFDTAKGKCIYEAAVGQIGYFTQILDASSGWLLCDGKSYSYTRYPQLAKLIGTQFGGTVNTSFNVPDYRGFFLRIYAEKSTSGYVRSNFSTYAKGVVNNSVTVPQQEGLPNIIGGFSASYQRWTTGGEWPYGKDKFETNMFKCYTGYDQGAEKVNPADYDIKYAPEGGLNTRSCNYEFSASQSNPIYGAQSGVTPPNMAVYAYIYAGKIVP